MNNKMNHFCNHIRAALVCYVDMTPDQQALAMMYAAHKINALDKLRAAANDPGGAVAADLLQKMQQVDEPIEKSNGSSLDCNNK